MILTPEDVGVMSEWWEMKGMPLQNAFLPELGFGVWEHDELMTGAFLCEMILSGGKGGLISWTIVNPDHMMSALRVVNKLLSEIVEYAVSNGFIALMGITNSRLLAKTYKDNGFVLGDENTNQYLLQ